MKLTPSQIETIELYLLSHELRDRDFYNEMLDHFMVTLENKLDEGEEFDYAFPELTHEFADFTFKPSWLLPTAYGLSGMEKQHMVNRARNFRNKFFKHFIKSMSLKILIIFAIVFALAVVVNYYGPENSSYKFVAILSMGLIFSGMIYKSRNKMTLLFRKQRDLSLEERKTKQLDNFDDNYFLISGTSGIYLISYACSIYFKDTVYKEYVFIPFLFLMTFLSITFFLNALNLDKRTK